MRKKRGRFSERNTQGSNASIFVYESLEKLADVRKKGSPRHLRGLWQN